MTILARMTMFTIINDSNHTFIKRHAKVITSIMAALINLLIIMVLTRVLIYLIIMLNYITTDFSSGF